MEEPVPVTNSCDILHGCDSVPDRKVLHYTVNQHGYDILEFLNESKLCVLNGRFNELNGNYTSVSRKGKSVVDFICIPLDIFNTCRNFSVLIVQSIVDAHAMHGLLGENSRLTDHYVVITEFSTDYSVSLPSQTTTPCDARHNLEKNDFD